MAATYHTTEAVTGMSRYALDAGQIRSKSRWPTSYLLPQHIHRKHRQHVITEATSAHFDHV